MTIYSFSYVKSPWDRGPIALLRNAKGWPPCINSVPIPIPLSSVFMQKVWRKSGTARIGASVRACLSALKASWCGTVQIKQPLSLVVTPLMAWRWPQNDEQSGGNSPLNKKSLKFLDWNRSRPVNNSDYLVGISSHTCLQNDVAKVPKLSLSK